MVVVLCVGRLDGHSPLRVDDNYRKSSNIRRTQSRNLHVSHLALQLSLPNPLKADVKSRIKIQSEQRRQAMLQLHLSDQQGLVRCDLY